MVPLSPSEPEKGAKFLCRAAGAAAQATSVTIKLLDAVANCERSQRRKNTTIDVPFVLRLAARWGDLRG